MGKDKSGQRTKGNTKPSSSGRSAELLGGVTGFIGFGGLSDLGYVPAATQACVDDDSQISAEFRVTLRKMSKKDSVTKMKALQEFEGLCTSEDIESIKFALPYWPRLYAKLSIDCDQRVRESTQAAHSTLVSQIGKNLAPYLRLVMPSWTLAMTDPHTPVAIAATKSFQSAFSEEKRPGVMIFCSKEIIAHISDNIFIQSSQTLSDPKSTEKEDQENKYIRVLFSSLKALSLLLESTSKLTDKKGEIFAKVSPVVEHEKFWKYSKHDSVLVRSAWYGVIKSLFEFDVELLRPYTEKLSKIIFSSLDSKDSAVLPHVWIAFLHLCVALPDCWDSCDNPKSVFNRMFSVLRDGGRGFISDISPQLLPILSVIPQRVMESPSVFYIDFFRALSSSLYKDKVLKVRRDVSAIVVALNECLKLISKEHGDNEELWTTLMKYQVVDLLCSSFTEFPQLSEGHLYQEIGKLLFYWSNSVDSMGKKNNVGKVDEFWNKFLPECISWVNEGEETKLIRLKQFFIIIKDPHTSLSKYSKGVRFADEKVESTCLSPSNANDNDQPSLSQKKAEHSRIISKYVTKLTKHCFETYKKGKLDPVYSLFSKLLFSYSSELTFAEIVEGEIDDARTAKFMFLDECILPFMETEESDLSIQISVEIFLHVYAELSEDDQKRLLMNLKPSVKVSSLRLLIEKMSEESASNAVASMWLKSPPLGSRLVKCLQQLCAIVFATDCLDNDSIKVQYNTLKKLICFVFSNGHKEYTVFSLEYQSQMLKVLKAILLQQFKEVPSSEKSNKCSEFILLLADLLNHLLNSSIHSEVDGLVDIIKQFYQMLCNPPNITGKALSDLRECFLRAFKQNLSENMPEDSEDLYKDSKSLISFVMTETKSIIMDDDCTFKRTIEISSLIKEVLMIVFGNIDSEDVSILLDHSLAQTTLDKILPTDFEWSKMENKLSPLYVAPSVLYGTFICREFPLPINPKETPQWNQDYTRSCLFMVNVINSLCKNVENWGTDSKGKEIDDEIVSLGQYLPLAVIALHGACHSSTILQMNLYLNNGSVSSDVKEGVEELSKNMKKLLSIMNDGNKRLIVKHLRDRCSYGNIFWCVTLGNALNGWLNVPVPALKLISELDDNFLGYTETKQMLMFYLQREQVIEILHQETDKLSQLAEDPFSALSSVCLITTALEKLSLLSNGQSDDDVEDDANKQLEKAIHTMFSVLVKWRDTANNIFLFASDLSGVPWEEVTIMVSIIRLLTVIVKGYSLHLLHSHWDIALCSLSAWVQSLIEVSQYPESNTVVAMFGAACAKCAGVTSELLSKLEADSTLKAEYPPTLVEEWKEFFAPSIYNTLLQKFIHCTNVYERERSVILYSLARSLALSVSCMNMSVIKELSLPPLFNIQDEESQFKLRDNLQTLLNHLSPLLLSRHPNCQSATYVIIKTSLREVMASWEENSVSTGSPDDDERESAEDWTQRPLPHTLVNILKEAEPIVDIALEDKPIGLMCEIIPYTDAYTYTNGYLLTWLLILTAVTYGEENSQQLYASYLRESGLLFNLLNIIFKLMPPKPTSEKKQEDHKYDASAMFNNPLTISAHSKVSSEFVSWLACQIYLSCLSQLPAAIRSWLTNLDRNSQQIVDKFTATYASPILIANELNAINKSTVKYNNMVVKSRPGAREIIATYTIDEASMEMVLRLAQNHPLSTVVLEDHKRVGVSISQWRNWLFGLNTMLSHRNTPLLNSLEFWKKNVDQKFEGIEECFICYYVLHGTNHQIPKLSCRTCKKKFHSICLYKWFNTSNNSTCPICRSLF